jgi:hypothetical protein
MDAALARQDKFAVCLGTGGFHIPQLPQRQLQKPRQRMDWLNYAILLSYLNNDR